MAKTAKTTVDVRAEILKATSVAPKKYEKPQAFLGRIVRALDGLADTDWTSMSEEAQNWANAAVAAASASEEIEGFPGDAPAAPAAAGKKGKAVAEDEDDAPTPVPTPKKKAKVAAPVEDEDDEPAPTPKKKAKVAAPVEDEDADAAASEDDEPKPTPAPKKKAKAPKGDPKKSPCYVFKMLVAKHPKKGREELAAMLEAKGHLLSPSTQAVCFYEVRKIREIFADLGLLKD